MTKITIQTQNLVKNFGSGESLTKVLRGLDIQIYAGEFVIIFGPSGSGKSTLLNIINGLETPTSGNIIIDGENIGHLSDAERAIFHQQKIGMVFQAYNLIPSLSVIQNITLPLVFAKVPKVERDVRAKKILADFELSNLALRLPSEISGGQQQRIGVMRALISNPPIVIADEPTGNLDSIATHNVMRLLLGLNRKYNNTTLIVTHDLSLSKYADRIVHIVDGSVIKESIKQKPDLSLAKSDHPSPFAIALKNTKDSLSRKILHVLHALLSSDQLDSLEAKELSQTLKFLAARKLGHIDQHELFTCLDKSLSDGGAGLYRSTAHHLADNFESMLELLS